MAVAACLRRWLYTNSRALCGRCCARRHHQINAPGNSGAGGGYPAIDHWHDELMHGRIDIDQPLNCTRHHAYHDSE